MNPTEIADALEEIANAPFNADEFAFAFAEATGNAKATISKLRSGSYNKSKLPGGVLMNRKFYSLAANPGEVAAGLDALRSDKKTETHRPAILIATDGIEVSAEHPVSGETRHFPFRELHHHFGFFLPAAGMSRYKAAEENKVDVRASGLLAKLYDALLKKNPDWQGEERRHELNQFMTRLIFCMFAEDVGIFSDDQFSRLIFNHAGDNGVEAHIAIVQAFKAMSLPEGKRGDLPAWTSELRYVNGGLFTGRIDCPVFDRAAFNYLSDACGLDWQEINPDIFGSMIQSVADPELRSELGMHYTSVPNILKVLGPLFLDDLDADIEKAWDRSAGLLKALERISNIRVFDPACGSGNFLVVAYRELREREMRILERLAELTGETQTEMWSKVSLSNFYGIEITDFGAETAKLSLFIAEYQANSRFGDVFGATAPALPLRDGGNVVCDNALRVEWETVCPPPEGDEEVYIVGNPPFIGYSFQSKEQKEEIKNVFGQRVKDPTKLDYVLSWFFLACSYLQNRRVKSALVATNSVCQGRSVHGFWPAALGDHLEIGFAYRPFAWRNNATKNATVFCVIVGIQNKSPTPKSIFDGAVQRSASNINAYLLDGPDITVGSSKVSHFDLPEMVIGCTPRDGGFLILGAEEKEALIDAEPDTSRIIRKFVGSKELINGTERYCLVMRQQDAVQLGGMAEVARRINGVRDFRLASAKAATRRLAEEPYRFEYLYQGDWSQAILVPAVSSERRQFLPVDRAGRNVIPSNANFALYDAPDWCIALIASRLHLVWIGTVCGRLESRFRYSNTLGWNTFPVPKFTEDQLEQLSASARAILKTRYQHHPKTIAQLYDPDKMPDDLREVHRQNDELLETMYIGRPFKNDTERLEKLFKLYAARIEQLKKEAA